MGKVFLSVFLLAASTSVVYLILLFESLTGMISSLFAGNTGGRTYAFAVPWALMTLAETLPLLLLAEIGGYIAVRKLRSDRIGHAVKWNVIPNHNIVVAMTAFNDETSIYDAVREFRSQPDVKEVVVVNNNSSDLTRERAVAAGARVVDEPSQGYGHACMRGLREALTFPKVNVVALAEGDMTFNGKDLAKIVPYLDNVDLVVGTRTTRDLVDEDSQMDWFYAWGNMFLARMVEAKFFDFKRWGGVRLTDVGCTMRAIRAEALRNIIDELEVGGNHFSPHMLMTAIANKLRVVEVPVTFRRRWGVSKGAGSNRLKGFWVGLRMIWHIVNF